MYVQLVAGEAAFLINKRPTDNQAAKIWAVESAKVLDGIFKLSEDERAIVAESGLANAKRFNTDDALDAIEAIYADILQSNVGK